MNDQYCVFSLNANSESKNRLSTKATILAVSHFYSASCVGVDNSIDPLVLQFASLREYLESFRL